MKLNPVDATALCLCLVTIWWSRVASRVHRILLAVLGALVGLFGTRIIDGAIAILLLGAAFIFELMAHLRHRSEEGPKTAVAGQRHAE
jgi:hypothetical protein